MLGGADAGAGGDRTPAHGADAGSEAAARAASRSRSVLAPGAAGASLRADDRLRVPASLKLTVPLILLGFAATLSAVNLLYHVPQAERAAEEDSRKRLAQEMSRLQSTLEYLLLKGDLAVAQHEIAVLAHNHDVILAALTDDRNVVIAATRRAWLGQPIADVLPQFDLDQAARRDPRASRRDDDRPERRRAARLRRHPDGRRARGAASARAPAACSSPTISSATRRKRARRSCSSRSTGPDG